MKILWICNIMLPVVAEHLGLEASNKEGWLSGLCSVILRRQQENEIELHVAFPVAGEMKGYKEVLCTKEGTLHCYGFYEDIRHAEQYEEALEIRIREIIDEVQPDVIHCFGTEFGHTLAAVRCAPRPERLLVGIQGVCGVIAKEYMADLPERVQRSKTFRDILKRDSMLEQQKKFEIRGKREREILGDACNIAGRTEFDRLYSNLQNPKAQYFLMNETLRPCFYEGEWKEELCEPHSIFVSQGDYPLKGLHYMLLALGKLREKYPDVKLYVAGNSLVAYETLKDKIKISAYGKYLRSLMKQYQLQDSVQYLGRLSAEEMKAQYLKSHLYVCCSANENSPNSLGEAMLLGMPCVAANVGGIPSLFHDGQDGILYSGHIVQTKEINNTCNYEKNGADEELQRVADALYDAITEMWDSSDKIKQYCEHARLHARKTHDREENYRKLMEIYAAIAEQNE